MIRKYAGPLICILFCFVSISTYAQDIETQNTQDAYLTLNYRDAVNAVITARLVNDTLYIPLEQVFGELDIDRHSDGKSKEISGYYLGEDNPYRIDFNTSTARVGKSKYRFGKSEYIIGSLDIYVQPSLLQKLFGLTFTVDWGELLITVSAGEELPVFIRKQRAEHRKRSAKSIDLFNDNPLIQPRQRNMFEPGVLDYNLNYLSGNKNSRFIYNFSGGGNLLGGDFNGRIMGNYSKDNSQIRIEDAYWRYVFGNAMLNQFKAGDLMSDGLGSFEFYGAEVSNEPAYMRTLYSNYLVDGYTKPGWDVDLYLNGQYAGSRKSDASGYYRFRIPLTYGSTYIDLTCYGPDGEVQQERRKLQIPFSFVPAGTVNYKIDAGSIRYSSAYPTVSNGPLLQSNVSVGFTNWLTSRFGFDYLDKPYYYNATSIRIGPNYVAALKMAPKTLYSAAFNAVYPSNASFSVQYDRFIGTSAYHPFSGNEEFNVSGYVPFRLLKKQFNLHLSSGVHRFSNSDVYDNMAGVNVLFNSFNMSVDYRKFGLSDYINTTVLWALQNLPDKTGIIKGSILRSSMDYNLNVHRVENLNLSLSKAVARYLRLDVEWNRNLLHHFDNLSLRVTLALPSALVISSYEHTPNMDLFAQNIQGSIGYDGAEHELVPTNRMWSHLASATFRMFLDANGNGIFDPGEQLVDDAGVDFRESVTKQRDKKGAIHVINLQPYKRYNVKIDLSKVKNPLLVPGKTEFSFITNADVFTKVDVPFYISGIIEGKVDLNLDKAMNDLSGIRLYARSLDGKGDVKTISTFSDGSFYTMGLLPGRYRLYIDPRQLDMLDAKSYPAADTLEIKQEKDGDQIGNLAFVLRPRSAVMRPPSMLVLAGPQNGATGQKNNISLNWNRAFNAEAYHLMIASDSTFSSIISDKDSLSMTSDELSRLNNATTYYWKVSASNKYGTGPWSNVWSFTTVSKSGLQIKLQTVHFDFDKSNIDDHTALLLAQNVKLLKDHQQLNVIIDAYTDHIGDDQYNVSLSIKRADAVKEFYMNHGIAVTRITVHGLGKAPVACTRDERSQANGPGCRKNRRVESHIYNKNPSLVHRGNDSIDHGRQPAQ
ncbi:MAG TPA: OmpA family protein [Balneolales bacterium]|nr:OmpA family protein [Balneolales bacterium]